LSVPLPYRDDDMAVLLVTIRPATASDREWAAALMTRSEPWVTLGRTLNASRASVADADYQVFVADQDGDPLGFLILDPRGVAGAPYIKSVGVRDDVRGRGVGSRLVAHAEMVCRQDGARDVFLCVSSFNPRARALYERLGYQSIGELTDFVIAGASESLLRKRLVADFAGSVKQTVRRVFAAEADDVLSLVEEYYDAAQVVARDGRAKMLGYLADSDSGVWLAYCDTGAVGCILYHPLPHMGSVGEVKRLYVRPAFRRRGIAQELLERLERFASSRGVEWLYLDTNDELRAAIAFYERNGYVRCPRYNDNPQATIFMRKGLTSDVQDPGEPRR